MNDITIHNKARLLIVETLCIIDDAKKYGWSEEEYEKVEAKLTEAINIINNSNPN